MKTRKTLLALGCTALMLTAIMLAALTACGSESTSMEPVVLPADVSELPEQADADSGATNENSLITAQEIGQGSYIFRFEVFDGYGTVTAWNVHTDETTVGEALFSVGLIDGDVSDFGLFVKEVNGLTVDFDTDQSWWAFYIDGEMAMAGVDQTEIEAGKVYAFVYTIG